MKELKQVITPHITIYKMQINSFISILFRVTSVLLILIIFIFSLVFLNDLGICGFCLVESAVFSLSMIVLLGISYVLVIFHLLAGILHIWKDKI